MRERRAGVQVTFVAQVSGVQASWLHGRVGQLRVDRHFARLLAQRLVHLGLQLQ